jgi:hypothetical protein
MMHMFFMFMFHICSSNLSIIWQVMPSLEASYLSWFKRRASMSVSELPVTLPMLSSNVLAALTLRSLTSTRVISELREE